MYSVPDTPGDDQLRIPAHGRPGVDVAGQRRRALGPGEIHRLGVDERPDFVDLDLQGRLRSILSWYAALTRPASTRRRRTAFLSVSGDTRRGADARAVE